MLTTLALLVPTFLPTPLPVSAPVEDVRERYVTLAEKKDAAGCQELWRKERAAILAVIDADLEGSLKVREDAAGRALDASEEARIRAQHARALWGAKQAEAVGHPFVMDYAASFVGWDEEQRSAFRAGQRAYGEARAALKKNDAPAALTAARRCRELAAPLGDWWGAQMGWEAEARAHDALGAKEEALGAWSRVRMVARTLSLVGDEYEATSRVGHLAAELGRKERARSAIESAMALAKELGDEKGHKLLEGLKGVQEILNTK